MNYAEFCTGVGGFRLGIEMSGIDLTSVYVNEIDDSFSMRNILCQIHQMILLGMAMRECLYFRKKCKI